MKVTIKQRLMVLLVVLMAGFIGQASFSILQLRSVSEALAVMESKTSPKISLTKDIRLMLTALDLSGKNLILMDDRFGFDELDAKNTLLKAKLTSQLTELGSFLQTAEGKRHLSEVELHLAAYYKVEAEALVFADKAVDAVAAKHNQLAYELNQKAFYLLMRQGMPKLANASEALEKIEKQNIALLKQDVSDAAEAYSNGRFLTWLTLVLVLLLSVVGWWLVVRVITARTRQLASYAERLARGHFDLARVRFNDAHDDVQDEFSIVVGANQILSQAMDLLMKQVNGVVAASQKGRLNERLATESFEGEWLILAIALNETLDLAERTTAEVENQNWVKSGLSDLAKQMLGKSDLADLAREVVNYLARYTDAQMGAFYVFDSNSQTLRLTGSFAYEFRKGVANQFALGEGLVGQSAFDRKLISVSHLPDDYARITSGLGDTLPRNILVLPLIYQGEIKGVLELCRVVEFDPLVMELLGMAADSIAVAIFTAETSNKALRLLQQTQAQAGQLQQQQEELQQSNEELEEQAQTLKASEEQLKQQQEELQQTNEELEEQTQQLTQQSEEVARKNSELVQAQQDIQRQADDLAVASKYKSEFLANMSHELRTPLNSMLILSRSLANNSSGNLNDKQVQAAKVMHQSGTDLLGIINNILDLSKIEAGREIAVFEKVELNELCSALNALYSHVAADKSLSFSVEIDKALPATIISDRQRLGQILRNLLSNAFKFTRQGGVTLKLSTVAAENRSGSSLGFNPTVGMNPDLQTGINSDQIALSVIDTGVGIPLEKQKHIWEAFQQADGSTSREFGGTGLGLTISRELAKLLGGKIQLTSEPGKGASFTLYLPIAGSAAPSATPELPAGAIRPDRRRPQQANRPVASSNPAKAKPMERIADDRASLTADESAILIVEDDAAFAQILADLCRENKIKYLACPSAEEALELISNYTILGVMLDMQLHELDGWSVLTRLKDDLDTLHIPVYVISIEERNRRTLQFGAVGFLQKPVTAEQLQSACETVTQAVDKKIKGVLLIEDDAVLRAAVHELLDAADVTIHEAGDGSSALEIMGRESIDLMVMDLGLPDMSGFELLERITLRDGESHPPVIIYTGRDLTKEEYDRLQCYSNNIIVKGVRSDERLVEEAAMFLHRRVASLPERARKMLASLRDRDGLFSGKSVLLVDDDIRNVFALSALLEERGVKVITARNGVEALKALAANPSIDMLLTDIMMPVMDGYELIQKVRAQTAFNRLPILALTAKAMKEDRDRCLEVGASDYLSKPIDVDRLLSVMRIWLYR